MTATKHDKQTGGEIDDYLEQRRVAYAHFSRFTPIPVSPGHLLEIRNSSLLLAN
ncbi:MAG: hypothetical protein ABIZ95_11200 [Pyrinomonadaceae bacterium]